MANEQNLNPVTSKSEARSRGRKGGIASGKARREKKLMRETLEAVLTMSMKKGKSVSVNDIMDFASLKGKNISVQEAIIIAQAQKAMKGDTRAAEFLRDTVGEKPDNNLNVAGKIDTNNPYDELTVDELKALAKKCEEDGES